MIPSAIRSFERGGPPPPPGGAGGDSAEPAEEGAEE